MLSILRNNILKLLARLNYIAAKLIAIYKFYI